MWNGAAPNLKAMPTRTNTTPRQNSRVIAVWPRRVNRLELQAAGGAVHHGHAVQQHARRHRAQHEVLHRRFRRTRVVAVHADQPVGTQRQQLQAEIQDDQAAGRNHQHHAQHREQAQHVELALEQAAVRQVRLCVDEDERGHHVHADLEHVAGGVAHEHAGKCRALVSEHHVADREHRRGARTAIARKWIRRGAGRQ